jgi:hypothetical protein
MLVKRQKTLVNWFFFEILGNVDGGWSMCDLRRGPARGDAGNPGRWCLYAGLRVRGEGYLDSYFVFFEVLALLLKN